MKSLALALAGGLLLILVFPRCEFVWLAPLALTPLVLSAAWEPRPLRRALIGWAAGFVYWFGVCYWIGFVLQNYAGLSVPLAWLAFLLFCLAKGLHMAFFTWAARYLMEEPLPRGRVSGWTLLLVAALWTGLERTHGPLGFAWLALGNAGIEMEIPMRLAPITGVYGLSFVFAMMNAAVALLILRRPRRELAPLLLLPLLYLLPPAPALEHGKQTAVLVQPNIEERQDWTPQMTENTIRQMALLSFDSARQAHPPPQLMLWPEAPVPFYYETDPFLREQAAQLTRLTGASLLFGAVGHTPAGEPLNSAYMIGPDGSFVARYDKMYLVPFGEFIPPLFGWINKISAEAGNFAPGRTLVTFPVAGKRAGVFICYESVFPHFVREFVTAGAQVLVNLSNDGYFGRSPAREQHLLIARMRAAENRRWLIRATNDGITATIDPAGRLTHKVNPYQQMAVRTRFSFDKGITPYTEHGDWFAWGCLGLVGFASAVRLLGARPWGGRSYFPTS